ncbi:hypothetical protein [Falsiruegeria litorea]|uniref:hypothetical protein n=1 Tax=Falsiruegeria litorea TaxID=1280831 RepID=UPI001BFE578C|nr:hypothetical protein [Falsiruegeria litorea]MBT8169675.1 hypothetical protein [Falsiruegeria litorea]
MSDVFNAHNAGDVCPVCETTCGFDPREGLCEELLRLQARQRAADEAVMDLIFAVEFASSG